ncbi:SPOR domain-containing protein [Campylobacter ureolyticus]|uniref:SPOR domain-containing protein n=1 Tax=Campylobacter ureolyticus TaxID=827 RepID=A0A9Q4KJX0_9BACT|nr:SPOR domain-containing protein [Campylobacter ureolyticus]MCZ6102742.1 SPOR domain-containing protein [Campylobacter ureolyticus]MCZ6161476.1 SPOR domain-containing protein [Campylobacter ureolyticus]MCZ6170240.1 SPOR domain-containing protein [Campylobacter ureolyticus]MDU4981254.1 SPOR domain-containing protein [Campylobacter ureolyticus]
MSDDRFSIDDNIVLDPKTAKTNNIKKILTGIAILVVLFLIVLIIMKFINSGNMEEPKPLVMPSEETIFKPKAKKPSQPIREIDEASSKNVETKKLEPQIVEIRPIRIEEAPKPEEKIEHTIAAETKDEAKQTIVKSSPKEEIKQEPKAETTKSKQEVVVVTSKKETPKQEPKKAIKEEKVKKETPKKEVKKQAPKAQKQESKDQTPAQSNVTQTTLQKGSYIQVLATADFKPDADYIKKLKSKGYTYTLYKTTVKGKEYIKVLVGPFNEAKLNSEMSNIRATINKDAFVFRVK